MIELRNITKRFGAVVANDRVNIKVRPGTIHAIVGENGAGKSTAMRIAYGFYTADSGEILINGKPEAIRTPHDAIAVGIGMVHQHFMLVESMTVTENIVLGTEPDIGRWYAINKIVRHAAWVVAIVGAFVGAYYGFVRFGGWLPVTLGYFLGAFVGGFLISSIGFTFSVFAVPLKLANATSRIRALSEDFKLAINPSASIESLSVGQQQRVELLKALYRDARLLILDEPTAVLTPQEVDEFFAILRRMREQGKTIVIITHKLSEVLAISDDVTVMRDGAVVGEVKTSQTNAAELARLMVGREVLLRVEKPEANPGEVVLSIKGLTISGRDGSKRVDGVTLDVAAGEIVGIAGVEGNGQTELIEALAGLIPGSHVAGSINFSGLDITHTNARTRKELGIAHVPEDRHRRGLLLDFSLAENTILGVHYRKPAVTGGVLLDHYGIQRRTEQVIRDFDVRPPDPALPARALSGGNQQKLIIGREFELPPKLLLVSQPTRGVDIGAIEFIHRKIVALRDAGCAVLLVSAELEEVTALSDRLLVIHTGQIVGEVDPKTATNEEIGLMMTGGHK